MRRVVSAMLASADVQPCWIMAGHVFVRYTDEHTLAPYCWLRGR